MGGYWGSQPISKEMQRPPARKTIVDYAGASLLLVILGIGFVCIAIAIKLDSNGPVFFRQPRIGLNNRRFIIYKFRTMYHRDDLCDIDGSRQAVRSDTRITMVGRWLRKYSIDEFPNLFNVLKGEMSLVGPRPHAPNTLVEGQFFTQAIPNYVERHKVLPGITGWAQVNGWRGETIRMEQLEQRVAHDLYYIDNWSLALDFHILLLTLTRELLGGNAF